LLALRAAQDAGDEAETLRQAAYLRALLEACREAADSVFQHLEAHGVSVDIVFAAEQLKSRLARMELLLNALLSPPASGAWRALLVQLVEINGQSGVRRLMGEQFSLMARQMAERHAETGEHYITTDRAGYRDMLRRAAGGGLVIAGTTFAKFAIAAAGLGAFWTGLWSGVNYAISFLIVMLLHWTVATKQPAMTAPALADSLAGLKPNRDDAEEDVAIEGFVDRVAQLIRSQFAGIVGNVAICGPVVLVVQLLAQQFNGAPLVGEAKAHYVLHSLHLWGPTLLFAAFTGVLLFFSSMVAGWAENAFVFHRLDSTLAWNPRITRVLGLERAQRWASWWRRNISGVVANTSLGLMLGLVPALLAFVGLGLEVRHVTLSTGQLAAALGALGPSLLATAEFWWCMAALVGIGVLNLGVSFWLALRVAIRSRGVQVRDRSRLRAALWRRVRQAPMSFLRPPPEWR
jgi:site-specific recombinase